MNTGNLLIALCLALIVNLPSLAIDPSELPDNAGPQEACALALTLDRPQFEYEEAFRSNNGLISKEDEQNKLRESRVSIIGMGGVGGSHLITLARMGVGNFTIADPDVFELKNFNRQYGADMPALGRPKVEVMKALALRINPELRINAWDTAINSNNVEEFLRGLTVLLDGLDAFAPETRRMVFMKAREMGITVITAGPIGFSTAVLVFTPESMSYEDYFDYGPDTKFETQILKFLLGLTPRPYFLRYMTNIKNFNTDKPEGPSLCCAVNLCAGFAASEAIKALLKEGKSMRHPTITTAIPTWGYTNVVISTWETEVLCRN